MRFDAASPTVAATRDTGRPYDPHVVIKLRSIADAAQSRSSPGAAGSVEESILQAFPGATVEPFFQSLAPELAGAEDPAAAAPEENLGDLFHYLRVRLPSGVDAERAVDRLEALAGVELAHVEGLPTRPPLIAAIADPDPIPQPYLDPAPDGIDALFAWQIPGGAGEGVSLIDIEQGWTLEHSDLRADLLSGLNLDFFGHGTAVLGVVAAVDNGEGVIGIVPQIGSLGVVSQWRQAGYFSTAYAIFDAARRLQPGDVLLLEAQNQVDGQLLPVEVDSLVHDAIRWAVTRGVTVIEPAGNGGGKLTDFVHRKWGRILDPGSPDFRDSGAILVSAATAGAPHARLPDCNNGERVDCYAWGERVATTGDGSERGKSLGFSTDFSGTSAAAAIVAGAAVAVQGMAKAKRGAALSPAALRDLLRDPASGTPSAGPANDLIGLMPDLQKIAARI